jgi:hypothetical protein
MTRAYVERALGRRKGLRDSPSASRCAGHLRWPAIVHKDPLGLGAFGTNLLASGLFLRGSIWRLFKPWLVTPWTNATCSAVVRWSNSITAALHLSSSRGQWHKMG